MADYGQDWDIKATHAKCVKTERAFKDGEEFVSRLVPAEDGYLREDYALEAWTDDLREGTLSSWHTVYRAPKAKEEEPFKPQDAESWLRRLMRDGAEEAKVTVYVLALMLERKRQIVEIDVQRREDGLLMRIYEQKKTGDVFLIPDPEVNLDEVAMVQGEVFVTLGWGNPAGQEKPAPSTKADEEDEEDESDESETPDAPASDSGTSKD